MSPNRVIIVDTTHIAHTHSRARNPLFHTTFTGETINTTIQTGIIKNLWRWSNKGEYPVLACFDRPCPGRKEYLNEHLINGDGYKGNRVPKHPGIRVALNSTMDILREGTVPAMAINNYEADDIVAAAVDSAKVMYPDAYIDVVTGDADMVPLVDERVSVFLRSARRTMAVSPSLQKNRYEQVTPDTYAEVMESKSAFKGLEIPYNSVLLAKLLRGDTSDNIKPVAKKLFRPKQYNETLHDMRAQGIEEIRYTQESEAEVFSYLNNIIEDSEIYDELLHIWRGMYLNGAYPAAGTEVDRDPLPNFNFGLFNPDALREACLPFGIRLT